MGNGRTGVPAMAGVVLGIVLLAAASMPGPARAAAHEGLYIGYGQVQVEIGGDMDGATFVGGGGSAEVLPDQPTARGNKYILGHQARQGAWEISYTRSKHDGVWAGAPFPSTFSSVNLDGKLFLSRGFFRPLALLGLGFTRVKVTGGSTDGSVVQDAIFSGMDLRFGGGVQLALGRHLALDLQVVKRLGTYTEVDGVVSGQIEDQVDGDGLSTSVELKYIFAQ